MRRLGQILTHQNRAVLSFVLVIALLVQGVFGASGACMMSMEVSDADQVQAMAHEGHDMAAMEAASDDGAATKSRTHICPPDGCDICDGKNCSQCSPFQYSAIVQQGPIFIKDLRLALPELAAVQAFIISIDQWRMPPGRAPPQNF